MKTYVTIVITALILSILISQSIENTSDCNDVPCKLLVSLREVANHELLFQFLFRMNFAILNVPLIMKDHAQEHAHRKFLSLALLASHAHLLLHFTVAVVRVCVTGFLRKTEVRRSSYADIAMWWHSLQKCSVSIIKTLEETFL